MTARLLTTTLAAALLAGACQSSQPAPATAEARSAGEPVRTETPAIHETYRGFFRVPRAFDPKGGMELAETPPQVIRDAEGFASFVNRIPKERIQKRLPAPPSDDPLLQDPHIDWDR